MPTLWEAGCSERTGSLPPRTKRSEPCALRESQAIGGMRRLLWKHRLWAGSQKVLDELSKDECFL